MFESRNLAFRYPATSEITSVLGELCSLGIQRLISPQIIVPINAATVLTRFEARHHAPFTGAPGGYELAIFHKDQPEHVIGIAGLYSLDFGNSVAEIGVSILAVEARGRGLGAEAHHRWIQFAFEDVGLERLTGTAKATNTAAIATAEKIGMKREGVLRSHRFVAGERIDIVLFGLLRSEWITAE